MPPPTRPARKKFDRQLFDAHDVIACNAVIDAIADDDSGLYARRNDDLYGPDIVVWKGFKPAYYIEVEHAKRWTKGSFPWPTVHIPERKSKFLNLGLSLEFWMLREDLKLSLVIPDVLVTPDRLMEVSNVNVRSGEQFYVIPLEEIIVKKL